MAAPERLQLPKYDQTGGRKNMYCIDPPGPGPRRPAGGPAMNDDSDRAGRGLRILAIYLAAGLALAFLYVHHLKTQAATALDDDAQAEAKAPPVVDIVTANPAPPTWTLNLPGETAAWHDSKIYARVNGYVAKWLVDIGDHVEKDQSLATIETPELDADLVAAKAKLVAAQAQLEVKRVDADFARTTYERWRDSPQGSVSKQEQDSKRAANEAAQAQVAAAQAQVQTDEAEVAGLTALTAFKLLKAPFAGIIVERNVDIGNLVTAGSAANRSPLYRISLDDPIRVFVEAPQTVAQLLAPGMEAIVTTHDSRRRFEGKVARTAMSIDKRARTLRTEVDLANGDRALVPGMYVEVAFQMKNNGVAEVPAAAVISRSDGLQTAVVDDEDRVRFRTIKTSVDEGGLVQVVDGLRSGEKVVLNVGSQITEGEKVRTNDAESVLLSAIARR
jgi:RND family efflux transporter MFP subunit